MAECSRTALAFSYATEGYTKPVRLAPSKHTIAAEVEVKVN
jgi:hypothetical protein